MKTRTFRVMIALTTAPIAACGVVADEAASRPPASTVPSKADRSVGQHEPAEPRDTILWLSDLPLNQLFDGSIPVAGELAAVDALIAPCMKALGFEYLVRSSAKPAYADERALRMHEGFGFVVPDEAEFLDPNAAKIALLSDDEEAAFVAAMGDDNAENPAGCAGAAWAEIRSKLLRFDPAATTQLLAERDAILGSREWAEASADWARCMNERGYPYDGLGEPQANFSKDIESPAGHALTEDEVLVSVADWDCRQQYVFPTQIALEAEASRRLVSMFPEYELGSP